MPAWCGVKKKKSPNSGAFLKRLLIKFLQEKFRIFYAADLAVAVGDNPDKKLAGYHPVQTAVP
ncbi:MAG: hypothetical protein A2729_00590 [Candidatus Buchananbacteria bacterium RIFCSPHIGHO2_01_FULL_39_14]|uniref:Uncharacterized protein n=2 Tax=Candidatus Buchananiibacteriota TaxID=1817903 RepID=A0A1G1YQ95_9BACT|nr:MAG: hypothetical protein A2729_00590 [Candidatus Buchananbacteria bacterium RIFCSPHIGHO2_01_FULL_39_14]OGY48707.1 MAG: hypothetical protein A3D39_04515 [Candidatus Buchananbacteria bacterium RIFCSPHIGHO2_02_FULL_39_17]OGY54518.1 MAG: hypothetical protein A2912_00200 [Candidatus Buchananbacteria bacterium RIFCSPLOWO2_01_FULL_40_23b]